MNPRVLPFLNGSVPAVPCAAQPPGPALLLLHQMRRFIYSAFLTVICLLCPAIIIWLDPWTWGLWRPEMVFLVSPYNQGFNP
jgi:hypothetical protein